MCTQQKIGKIHQSGAVTVGLVEFVDTHPLRGHRVAHVLYGVGSLAFILARVDVPLGLSCRPLRLFQSFFLDQTAQYPVLVIRIQNLEILRQPGFLPMHTQQAVGKTVKGADPHRTRRNLQQLLCTLSHLPGRLVGECYGQDAEW